MGHPQIIEGTGNEIGSLLQSEPFASLKLRVYVDQDEVDLTANLADPPFTIRDREHLIELLLQGINSPTHEVTEETWERRRQRIRNRNATRQHELKNH